MMALHPSLRVLLVILVATTAPSSSGKAGGEGLLGLSIRQQIEAASRQDRAELRTRVGHEEIRLVAAHRPHHQ